MRKFSDRMMGSVFVAVLLLNGCGIPSDEEKFLDFQKGFMTGSESLMAGAEDGYYTKVGSYLYFFKKDLSEGTIVCGKPECLHEKEEIEDRIYCDAYLNVAQDIQYYGGKIYTLELDITSKEKEMAIYQISRDGAEKTKICNLKPQTFRLCAHRGNFYVCETEYDTSKGEGVFVERISMKNPSEKKVLFERWEKEKSIGINHMTCYEDACYFDVTIYDTESSDFEDYRLDLNTEELSESVEGVEEYVGSFAIDQGGIFYTAITRASEEEGFWKARYYRCQEDGTGSVELPTEKFQAAEREAYLQCMDSKYVYFDDIDYGKKEVPSNQRKLTIYDYEGNQKGWLKTGRFSDGVSYMAGDETYFFIRDYENQYENEKEEIVWYYVSKKDFQGGELHPVEFFRYKNEEMMPIAAYETPR